MQLLRQPADGPHPAAERPRTQRLGRLAEHGFRPPQEPRQHPHAVADQAAVGRVMDVGPDRGGVRPELAAAGHLAAPGQFDGAVIDRLQRPGADELGPADQHGVVGDLLEVDAAELSEDQAVVDEVLGPREAPAVQPHHDEHPEDDLDGRGGAAVDAGHGVAPAEVVADAGEDLIVVEESIELGQPGLEPEAELRDQGEEVGGFVTVAEHVPRASETRSFGPSPLLRPSVPGAETGVHFAPQTSSTALTCPCSDVLSERNCALPTTSGGQGMDVKQIRQLEPKLTAFLDRFHDCFGRKDTRAHLGVYVRGQLSDLPEKERRADRPGRRRRPATLQEFLAQHRWQEDLLRDRLQHLVASEHQGPHTVGIIDETRAC